jgi:CubicO group peptidase (beta-lactamase class C family)
MTVDRRAFIVGALASGAGALRPARASAASGLAPAAAYHAARRGISLLVMRAGALLFEDYPNGGAADRAHELASGTKSFLGIIAAAAAQDRLLELDEPAAQTLPEWQADPDKRRITVRQILNLTSGLATRRSRGDLLTYEESIAVPLVAAPGERFAYGGDPFQLFGAILHRKLRERETPVEYLKRRILDPGGIAVGAWRDGPDGLPRLGSGARLTARNWARFGELVRRDCKVGARQLVDPEALAASFRGTAANPAYGLGWWLNRPMPDAQRRAIPQLVNATDVAPDDPNLPRDLIIAAGAGQQRLYLSKSEQLVVVRQADGIGAALRRRGFGWPEREGARWSDREFWAALRVGLRG